MKKAILLISVILIAYCLQAQTSMSKEKVAKYFENKNAHITNDALHVPPPTVGEGIMFFGTENLSFNIPLFPIKNGGLQSEIGFQPGIQYTFNLASYEVTPQQKLQYKTIFGIGFAANAGITSTSIIENGITTQKVVPAFTGLVVANIYNWISIGGGYSVTGNGNYPVLSASFSLPIGIFTDAGSTVFAVKPK